MGSIGARDAGKGVVRRAGESGDGVFVFITGDGVGVADGFCFPPNNFFQKDCLDAGAAAEGVEADEEVAP